MKSEYRSILAVALSTVVLILWFTVINPPPKPGPESQAAKQDAATTPSPQTPAAAQSTSPLGVPQGEAPQQPDPQENFPVVTTAINTDLYKAAASSDNGAVTSWKILRYREGTEPTSPPTDMVAETAMISPALHLSFLDANFAVPKEMRYQLISAGDREINYGWRSNEIEISKRLTFQPDRYQVDVAVEIKNLSTRVLEGRPMLTWSGVSLPPPPGGFFSFLKQPPSTLKNLVAYRDGKVFRESNVAKVPVSVEQPGIPYWSGIEDRYFIAAIIPRIQGEGVSARFGAVDLPELGRGARGVTSGIALAKTILPPGESARQAFTVYAGPKDIEQLKEVGARLDEAIDYGWFTVVAVPILYLLRFFYWLIHNYGVAIILLTLFIKLLLHPISKKSMKSMKAMQRLQPKLKELQAKFKDDKTRLNQETMQLFRAHKVNPASGCLPMLLQFPVYIALYKVLWNSIELYHEPFFWFYRDLAAPDPYFITPILLGLFMVAQQKLTPSASADPMQQKMMMLMPVMFSVFMLFLPAGLVLYILVNTVVSVLQQWMYNNDVRVRDLLRGRFPVRSAANAKPTAKKS